MTPEEARDRIRAAILARPDLRWSEGAQVLWDTPEGWNEFTGFCYIATEAFCDLIPEAKPRSNGVRSHFWAEIDGEVWDLTLDQFGEEGFDHSKGKPTRFKQLSRRGRALRDTALGVLVA